VGTGGHAWGDRGVRAGGHCRFGGLVVVAHGATVPGVDVAVVVAAAAVVRLLGVVGAVLVLAAAVVTSAGVAVAVASAAAVHLLGIIAAVRVLAAVAITSAGAGAGAGAGAFAGFAACFVIGFALLGFVLRTPGSGGCGSCHVSAAEAGGCWV